MKKSVLIIFLFMSFNLASLISQNNNFQYQPVITGKSIFLIDSIRYKFFSYDKLVDHTLSVYYYDKQNNVKEIIYHYKYLYNEDHRDIYEYDNSNLLITNTYSIMDTNNKWKDIYTYRYDYDNKKRLLHEDRYEDLIDIDSPMYRTLYFYNDFDSISKQYLLYYLQGLDSFIVLQNKTKTYDTINHKLILSIDTIIDNNKISNLKKIDYIYDSSGLLSEEDVYQEGYCGTDIPGEIDTMYYYGKILYKYDFKNNLTEKREYIRFYGSSKYYLQNLSTYKYDLNNNLSEISIYDDSSKIHYQYLYYYHQVPSSISLSYSSIDKFFIYPNPVSDNLQIQFPYNNSDFVLKIFNSLGIVVYENNNGITLNNGNNLINISVSEFPSGIYFCSVSSQNCSEMKKFTIIR